MSGGSFSPLFLSRFCLKLGIDHFSTKYMCIYIIGHFFFPEQVIKYGNYISFPLIFKWVGVSDWVL